MGAPHARLCGGTTLPVLGPTCTTLLRTFHEAPADDGQFVHPLASYTRLSLLPGLSALPPAVWHPFARRHLPHLWRGVSLPAPLLPPPLSAGCSPRPITGHGCSHEDLHEDGRQRGDQPLLWQARCQEP